MRGASQPAVPVHTFAKGQNDPWTNGTGDPWTAGNDDHELGNAVVNADVKKNDALATQVSELEASFQAFRFDIVGELKSLREELVELRQGRGRQQTHPGQHSAL